MLPCKHKKSNVMVSELLIASSINKKINYCQIMRNSFDKKPNKIKEFSLLNFRGSSGYDHGAILVELIVYIGEKNYCKELGFLKNYEKNTIYAYLRVGLEYGRIKIKIPSCIIH
jgi:hypothetical protein